MYGGVFVRLPKSGELDNVDLYQRSLDASAKRGELDQFMAAALIDGRIDDGEAKKIHALLAQFIAASHEEVGAVIELHKNQ
ncbi:hypothetical protein D3C76_1333100 [compost metagenome]